MNKPFLRGRCAVSGEAKGVVRIVKDQNDIEAFQEGEIFVAFTSNPEMVKAMKKASAIITDVGGTKMSTVHPAIVARELGTPCIIRTRVASRKLKTGDFVRVDATKGNVYRLKA